MAGAGALVVRLETVPEATVKQLGLVPGGYARLSVVDSGPGMSPEVLGRCLEPFFTTKGRGQGSGLGLSTVYGLTVERGGLLTIDSAPGRGTAVHVVLPTVSDEAVSVQADEPFVWPAGRVLAGRVLLVEDEYALRHLAERSLSDIGLDVVSVGCAEPVLARPEDWATYDVLITDLVLPGMGGAELAQRLRATVADLPVLYTTGYADPSSGRHPLVPGSRMLRKPYRSDELRFTVASIIDEAQSTQEAQSTLEAQSTQEAQGSKR
jgi:CheY-like chemotaxis protein